MMKNGEAGLWKWIATISLSLMLGAGFNSILATARAETVRTLEVRMPLVEQRMERVERDIDRLLTQLQSAISKMDRYHEAR